ncbi:MAG TPA: 3-deoxy-8-phosphooctulonate synthase [Spirochaetota bacterium]|nr:3-deoxy-8-phosphooctulonate synthase [Spirochaetota bacterium]
MFLNDNKLILIAGPCVIESYEQLKKTGLVLKEFCQKEDILYIFKSSYDKANRSALDAFRGPGPEEGLEMLAALKKELDIPVLSDVHSPEQVEKAAAVLDILQIPAFLSRQTDLLVEAGRRQVPVNVKKGQFMSPYEVENIITKYLKSGGDDILITERGTFFGYGNLVVDFRSLPIIKNMGVKYIFDATHSLQLPAARGSSSGGARQYLPALAHGQIAAGADGIFMEIHPEPDQAQCDRETQYPLKQAPVLLRSINKLFNYIKQQNRR